MFLVCVYVQPYKMITIQKSTRKDKKYMATDGDKTVHFGSAKMSDYTKNKDEERKKRYIQRHSNEDHSIKNVMSPAFMARHVLWSEKTIPEAVAKLNKKYKVRFVLK